MQWILSSFVLLIYPYPSGFLFWHWGNWPCLQIPECIYFISHDAPFRAECAHLCSEWSIVGYRTGAFWDLLNWFIAWLPRLSNLEEYEQIGRFLSKTNHDKTQTLCIIPWTYLTHVQSELALTFVHHFCKRYIWPGLLSIRQYFPRCLLKTLVSSDRH